MSSGVTVLGDIRVLQVSQESSYSHWRCFLVVVGKEKVPEIRKFIMCFLRDSTLRARLPSERENRFGRVFNFSFFFLKKKKKQKQNLPHIKSRKNELVSKIFLVKKPMHQTINVIK